MFRVTTTFTGHFDGRVIVPEQPTDPPQNERLVVTVRVGNSSLPAPTPGSQLLKHAGTLTSEEAEEQRRIIEEGCEGVDDDEW